MAVVAKNQWIYPLLFFWVCAWYPILDPTIIKLAVVPLLFCCLKPNANLSKVLFILLILMSCILLGLDPYDRRFWLAEIVCIGFWLLGMHYSRQSSPWFAVLCSLCALILLLAQRWELLPWVWNQHIVFFDREIIGKTLTLPSFFPTPGNMLICFVLLSSFLEGRSLRMKLIYICLTMYPVLQSGSSLGTGLYLIAMTHLFVGRKIKFLALSAFLILMLLLLCLPRNETMRPLANRMLLWQPAITALEFKPHGFSYFHKHSGSLLAPETTARKITRNQFHPHNDLLHFGLSLGFPGLILRISFYIYIFYLVFSLKAGLVLLLFLFQIQFTPDAMSYPSGPLFFFLVGQLHTRRFLNTAAQSPKPGFSFPGLTLAILMTFLCTKMIMTSWQHFELMHGRFHDQPFYPTPAFDYNVAAFHMKSGDLSKAILTLEKLNQMAPNFHDANYLLGLAYAKNAELSKAADVLKRWIRIDPQHLHSYLLLTDILKKEMKLTEAEDVLRQGILCLPEVAILKEELKGLESFSSSSSAPPFPPNKPFRK